MIPFQALGIAPRLARAAAELGFQRPTPVQAQAIPPILCGADVLVTAQTGSGKTAAYALPLLARLHGASAEVRGRARALVLVPTRELAAQAGEVVRKLGQQLPRTPRVAILFGGVSPNPQMMALRGGTDVVVATPGRLIDLVEQNALSLADVRTLVLDEADRLLDFGFADELQRVLRLLPAQRQNLFFSATFPPEVETLAARLLRDPVRIRVPDSTAHQPAVVQRVIRVDEKRRTELLKKLIRDEGWKRALVFVATKYAAGHVASKLHQSGIAAAQFHGDMSQGARKQVLADFKAGVWDVVVTTDLAARGIDIAQLGAVVNYDLPRSAVDYLHRIGRTARAGATGLAVSFVTAASEAHLRLIEKRQQLDLPREQVAGFEPTEPAPIRPDLPDNGGIKGRRPSRKDKLRAAQSHAAEERHPSEGLGAGTPLRGGGT